jgi:hypothetical protein
MPSFVQWLMDQATAGALNALPTPSTLSAALSKIAELEAENADAHERGCGLRDQNPFQPRRPRRRSAARRGR